MLSDEGSPGGRVGRGDTGSGRALGTACGLGDRSGGSTGPVVGAAAGPGEVGATSRRSVGRGGGFDPYRPGTNSTRSSAAPSGRITFTFLTVSVGPSARNR